MANTLLSHCMCESTLTNLQHIFLNMQDRKDFLKHLDEPEFEYFTQLVNLSKDFSELGNSILVNKQSQAI